MPSPPNKWNIIKKSQFNRLVDEWGNKGLAEQLGVTDEGEEAGEKDEDAKPKKDPIDVVDVLEMGEFVSEKIREAVFDLARRAVRSALEEILASLE